MTIKNNLKIKHKLNLLVSNLDIKMSDVKKQESDLAENETKQNDVIKKEKVEDEAEAVEKNPLVDQFYAEVK